MFRLRMGVSAEMVYHQLLGANTKATDRGSVGKAKV